MTRTGSQPRLTSAAENLLSSGLVMLEEIRCKQGSTPEGAPQSSTRRKMTGQVTMYTL